MTVERATMSFAGFMVLLSLALTWWVHPNWVWLTVFVGANLFQAGLTGFCPVSKLMARMGMKTEGQCAQEAGA